MNTNKNTIALLVPCYNAERFVENFCRDVSKLTPAFDEVIFYNDGSTDDTLRLLKQSGHRYISHAVNQGPGVARNRLLEATGCNYVHFHDVDDPIDNSYLQHILTYNLNDFAAILCNADWVDAGTGEVVCKWEYTNSTYRQQGPAYLIRNPVGGINGLYNRKAVLDSGGFDEDLRVWEDADLNLRLALQQNPITFTESVLVKSLRYSGSASANQGRIRNYKYRFLCKHFMQGDVRIKHELISQLNKLYHEALYERDWDLHGLLVALAKAHKISLPVTSNPGLKILKAMLGAKNYTLFKRRVLNRFVFATK